MLMFFTPELNVYVADTSMYFPLSLRSRIMRTVLFSAFHFVHSDAERLEKQKFINKCLSVK